MKPFNLERALAGDPVVTRGGRPVEQITNFKTEVKCGQYTLYGVVDGYIHNWTLDGRRESDTKESPFDLFMASTKRGGWMNVYPNMHCNLNRLAVGSHIHESKKFAERAGANDRIACVYVEWEE